MYLLDQAPSCRILCPRQRFVEDEERKVTTISGRIHHIINTSYIISDAEDENSNHSLLRRDRKEGEQYLSFCEPCFKENTDKTYYWCMYCHFECHKECAESPPKFHSADHPKHPLQLAWFPVFSGLKKCFSCNSKYGNLVYYCSICDFLIHAFCARNPTSPTIYNRKRHEHTLHYFPRKSTLVCDVCGLEGGTDYLYVCLKCDFIVHKSCVDLPYVIKVSRHVHRLAFTPNLPYKELTNCGVCHAKINENYGEYSCTQGCAYAVHSRCAMQSDVCDGRELEGEPEETYENTQMFEEVGDGIIRHLSHSDHNLRLEKNININEDKHCQACRFSFYDDGNVYQCMQCDFILHESCANLPRVKQYILHIHPLFLELDYTKKWFICKSCQRHSFGFVYVCRLERCRYVRLDTRCASICEPFEYHSHPHPLFITNRPQVERCSLCQRKKEQILLCGSCRFCVCFPCATLPHKARYEHDEHLLTFYHQENVNDEIYRCEICEEDINPENGLYGCNECTVTVHIECLLGRDPCLKAGLSSTLFDEKVDILPNTYSTRPICKFCKRRCPYKIKIETCGESICSFSCRYSLGRIP